MRCAILGTANGDTEQHLRQQQFQLAYRCCDCHRHLVLIVNILLVTQNRWLSTAAATPLFVLLQTTSGQICHVQK